MFLQLNHQQMQAYKISQRFEIACYGLTNKFPQEERFALVQQIRRAAVSVQLNIAEGCSRKSVAERKRFFEISRGSLVEIDAALDIAVGLGYCQPENLTALGSDLLECFKMISALMQKNSIL